MWYDSYDIQGTSLGNIEAQKVCGPEKQSIIFLKVHSPGKYTVLLNKYTVLKLTHNR